MRVVSPHCRDSSGGTHQPPCVLPDRAPRHSGASRTAIPSAMCHTTGYSCTAGLIYSNYLVVPLLPPTRCSQHLVRTPEDWELTCFPIVAGFFVLVAVLTKLAFRHHIYRQVEQSLVRMDICKTARPAEQVQ